MISRIRLAWWREALEKLDHAPPPPEPLLRDIAEHVIPTGITGAELAEMEQGWASLLSPDPLTDEELALHARARGGALFRLSARLLGGTHPGVEPAGEAWALADLARRSGNQQEAASALAAAATREFGTGWPSTLRPLGMLAVLARRDSRRLGKLERPGAPARLFRMITHRLTGR